MKIEYFHASKYGNGALVSEEFEKQLAAKGVTVTVHHIRDARPKETPPADHRSFFGRDLFRLEKIFLIMFILRQIAAFSQARGVPLCLIMCLIKRQVHSCPFWFLRFLFLASIRCGM